MPTGPNEHPRNQVRICAFCSGLVLDARSAKSRKAPGGWERCTRCRGLTPVLFTGAVVELPDWLKQRRVR
jgi:hypothetical protein